MRSIAKSSFHKLLNILQGDGLRAQLLRGGVGSILLKISSMGLQLAIVVMLARVLGPENYGVYAYVFALVSLLSIPAQFGLPDLVVRETAKAHADGKWEVIRGLWRWSNFSVIFFAATLSVFAVVSAQLFEEKFTELQLMTFFWGIVLVPLLALTRLYGAKLQGLRKVVQGQLPESIIRPGLFLMLIILAIMSSQSGTITSSQAMAFHALCSGVAFMVCVILLFRERPNEVNAEVIPEYQYKQWIKAVLPLAFISGMAILNTQIDIVMLGIFKNAADVGMYRVASQGAALVSFGLTAIAMVVMPYFAKFHSAGDMLRFQRLATTGSRAMLALALPVALVFILFGEQVLHYVFGEEYILAHYSLAILSVAHVVHAGFGVVGPLLNMTGYERVTAKGIAIAAISNIFLNVMLIPLYGMEGAALATALTFIIWNVVLWNSVRLKLGVDSSALNLNFSSELK